MFIGHISTIDTEQSIIERVIGLSELEDVLKSIETLRSKLNKIAKEKNLTDLEVVSASQMLDVLLNEYQKLMKDKVNRK